MLRSVPIAISLRGCGTTTWAGLVGCLKFMWSPLPPTCCQPSDSSRLMMSALFICVNIHTAFNRSTAETKAIARMTSSHRRRPHKIFVHDQCLTDGVVHRGLNCVVFCLFGWLMETENRLRMADVFVGIHDPRQAKKVEHNLVELLMVSICGVLAGADDFGLVNVSLISISCVCSVIRPT